MEKDDRRNGPILTKVESTQIFGNIEEIYHLHLSIAEQLDRALADDECIGAVFLANVCHSLSLSLRQSKHTSLRILQSIELLRVYQPYTKFYDKTIEAIHTLEKTNSRFYAFLKVPRRLGGKHQVRNDVLFRIDLRASQRVGQAASR